MVCAQGRNLNFGAESVGQGIQEHQEQVPQGLGPLCISQVTEEETRRFGHCLLTRIRSEVLEGWMNRSLEN